MGSRLCSGILERSCAGAQILFAQSPASQKSTKKRFDAPKYCAARISKVRRIEIKKFEWTAERLQPLTPGDLAFTKIDWKCREIRNQHGVAKIESAWSNGGRHFADQIQVVVVTQFKSRVTGAVAGTAEARVDFNEQQLTIASVALEFNFAKADKTDCQQELVAYVINFLVDNWFHERRAAVEQRVRAQLLNDTSIDAVPVLCINRQVAVFGRIGTNDLLLKNRPRYIASNLFVVG